MLEMEVNSYGKPLLGELGRLGPKYSDGTDLSDDPESTSVSSATNQIEASSHSDEEGSVARNDSEQDTFGLDWSLDYMGLFDDPVEPSVSSDTPESNTPSYFDEDVFLGYDSEGDGPFYFDILAQTFLERVLHKERLRRYRQPPERPWLEWW
jgi:hypothetical protein